MHNSSITCSYDITTGINETLWLEEKMPVFDPLNTNIETDVCIVGAGIGGLSVAYHLIKAGKKVIVIDAKEPGSGETGRTTAHLTNAYDDYYYKLADVHGEDIARLVAESHTWAIQSIENIILTENIECDFKRLDGYLFLDSSTPPDVLKKECEAAQKAGLHEVVLLASHTITGFPTQPVLHFPHQAQFHPIKYLKGLAKIITENGGFIYTHTVATEIKHGKIIQIKTNRSATISANRVVIATNAPIFDKSFTFAKQTSCRSYVIAGLIPRHSLKHALYWDTAEPYHYMRLQPYSDTEDVVIIGGEDHRTGKKMPDKNAPFRALESWGRTHLPAMTRIIYQWSGQIQEPADLLAYIGRVNTSEKNVFIVTGDSGNGMTHGSIAGCLISDLVLNKQNRWTHVYDPRRSAFKNCAQLIKHNLLAMGSYWGYLTPGDTTFIKDIECNDGGVVRKGLHKAAIYRDKDGTLCEQQAVCTHMGAPLTWNPVEKTWDCPAHGSRFSPCGKVLQGPAINSLKK